MTALQRTIAVDNHLAKETLISPSGISEIREHSEETNWHRLVRTPLKFGMEYLELDLRDVGPTPWHLKLEEEALAIGFVSKTTAQISLPESELERIDSGHWFRFSGREMIIDQTSHAGTRINLVIYSKKVASYLLDLDPDQPHPLLIEFIDSAAFVKFSSGQMSPAALEAAKRLATPRAIGIAHRLELEAGVISWIARMLEQFNRPAITLRAAVNGHDRDSIQLIVEALAEDPGAEYSLNDLCEIGRINEHKLKSAFKHIHGKTPFTFLREIRMDHAAKLLREDRLSVIQVANEVGYSNASHFARAFKDRHQLLPKAYQCLHRD